MMTQTQFDAIVRLRDMNPNSKLCQASRSFFVDGLMAGKAAKLHNCSEGSLRVSIKVTREAIRDCYIFITGEVPE